MSLATVANADRLARQVLTKRLHVQPKESVTIECYPSALPWAAGFVREARRLGAYPLVHYEDERSYWTAVEEGRADLVGTLGPAEWAALRATDVYIYFWGPEDNPRLSRIPEKAQGAVFGFNGRWYETARKAGVRGARMAIARATDPSATYRGIPRATWEREVFRASLRDPRSMAKDADRLRRAFERGKELRVRHANGTDVTLALGGYPVNVTLGEVTPADLKTPFGMLANVPDGTVYLAVDPGTADGTVVANRANAGFGPSQVGGRFRFRGGRLAGFSFSAGGSAFRSGYREAGKERDLPSFIEVGLNPDLHRAPGLHESEAGAVTVGVGANASFGGPTKGGFLGSLTVAGAELSVDGTPLVRGGRVLR
jgi:leucyl aminopeptidase (aminopeptidase T)